MSLVDAARRLFRRSGLDIVRYDRNHGTFALLDAMRRAGVTHVIDVGAHHGEWAVWLRKQGWSGPIRSFEPSSASCGVLQAEASRDPSWQVTRAGVSDVAGSTTLILRRNSQTSSILEAKRDAAPDDILGEVGRETVPLVRLDDAMQPRAASDRYLLKIDTQGYERNVIEGARALLTATPLIHFEATLREIYAGEMLLPAMLEYVGGLGYEVMFIRPVWFDPETHHLLNIDVLCGQRSAPAAAH